PGLYDLDLDWEPGSPEYQIVVDREKAGRLGLTAYDIGKTIQTMVKGTQELTKFRQGGKEYDIAVRAQPGDREWIEAIKQIDLIARDDKVVPLVDIAAVRSTLGPSQINRDDRQRSVTIEASTGERALSEIVEDVEQRLSEVEWPAGYGYEIGGSEEDRREAFAGMGIALVLGILLIYMILAAQFESFVHPFTIMLAIPLEVIGVVIALLLTNLAISIMVMLGILMLTGIVVSNSILLVQMINLLRERGYELREAIIEGGTLRLRPILMTAIATLFAMIPLALGLRAGSEMWQPLAIAVIGGLFTSTFLTLFVVPVAYSLNEQFANWLRRLVGLAA
ncbi:MAG: efflux RND transporter permease subunit, partial [Armatimonadetes bacterium]|nr:efflux RND transporter permease subunit [Armatimonadota bacterium]